LLTPSRFLFLLNAAEERQDANQKRRKVEEARRAGKDEPHFKDKGGQDSRSNLVGMQLNGETLVQVVPAKPSTSNAAPAHPSLPSRPAFDLVPAKEDPTSTSSSSLPSVPAPPLPDATFPPMQRAPEPAKPVKITEKAKGIKALGGSNNDLVANRRAIRMANMSAAEMLKAELAGVAGEKVDDDTTIEEAKEMHEEKEEEAAEKGEKGPEEKQEDSVMADGEIPIAKEADITVDPDQSASDAAFDAAFPPPAKSDVSETPSRGTKRKADEDDDDEDESKLGPGDDGEEAPDKAELTSIPHMDQPVEKPTGRVVNADGTVEYEDTVKYVSCFFPHFLF
jgi:5'-3' exoribonuclease 2